MANATPGEPGAEDLRVRVPRDVLGSRCKVAFEELHVAAEREDAPLDVPEPAEVPHGPTGLEPGPELGDQCGGFVELADLDEAQ